MPSTSSRPGTYIATVNQDVGPTPYWIEIFDLTSGARLAVCGDGTSCPAYYTPGETTENLVAFVSSASTALPPPATQANSGDLSTFQQVITT